MSYLEDTPRPKIMLCPQLLEVFDAIGFVYPNYRYSLREQEKNRKIAASVIQAEPVPKSKMVKVLTHRPCYIEPAVVPEFWRRVIFSSRSNTNCSDCTER
jgi:hypothetical protein